MMLLLLAAFALTIFLLDTIFQRARLSFPMRA
jgi:hypothetical protein